MPFFGCASAEWTDHDSGSRKIACSTGPSEEERQAHHDPCTPHGEPHGTNTTPVHLPCHDRVAGTVHPRDAHLMGSTSLIERQIMSEDGEQTERRERHVMPENTRVRLL